MKNQTHKKRIILGVTESDSHVVANHLIAHLLRSKGFEVTNLGACTPLKDFADAAEKDPDSAVIIIGSLNGHAFDDLRDLPEMKSNGRIRCPVILGGNVSVGAEKCAKESRKFKDLGIDFLLRSVEDLIPALSAIENDSRSEAV